MPMASKNGSRTVAVLLFPILFTLLGIIVNAQRCLLGCATEFELPRFLIACAFVLSWLAAAFLLGFKQARRTILACGVFGATVTLFALITAILFSQGLDAAHFTMIPPSLAALFPLHGFFPAIGGPDLWYAVAAVCAGIGVLCAAAYFTGRVLSGHRR